VVLAVPPDAQVQRVAANAADVEEWSGLGVDVFEEVMRSILDQRPVNSIAAVPSQCGDPTRAGLTRAGQMY
jgi:hypothetical protein